MSIRSLCATAVHPPVRIGLAVCVAFAAMVITLLSVRPEMMMSLLHGMMSGL
jgi:hypothetical protein